MLCGKIFECTPTSSRYSPPHLLRNSNVSNADLSKFRDLETVGIKSKEIVESYSDTRVHREFESAGRFVNGRSEVTLPWKDEFANQRLTKI